MFSSIFKASVRRLLVLMLLFLLPLGLMIACGAPSDTPSEASSPAKSLVVGVPQWPGFGSEYVAHELGLFKAEGVEVEEIFFPVQSDSNAAFLAGKVDLILTGIPDLITMASREQGLKLLMLCDYSNGSDGILGRNIEQPADLKGKTVAREDLLLQILLLRKYLEQGGLTEDDVNLVVMPASDAATAFAAKKVDAAVTWEPWLTKAANEGDGEIIFTSKGTNIIPDGFVTRDRIISDRRPELLAYFRAIDKAVQMIDQKDDNAIEIIAEKLGVTPEEALQQMSGVQFFGVEGNKTVVFNPQDPMNIFDSLKFAAQTAKDINLTPELVDTSVLVDDSIVKEL